MSFSIGRGEFVSILGPSGCGKSTVLQLVAGLEKPNSGEVLWNNYQIVGPAPERGIVFQVPKLFPWATVRSNVEWGLRMRGITASDRMRISTEMLSNVGLLAWANRYVKELSGGMRQRVAIARTLANECDLILMDEPFVGLDVQTRMLMQRFIVSIWSQMQKTVLLVTHSIDEALMADRVIVFSRRPARILEDLSLDLPRPRDIQAPEFISLRSTLTRLIEAEVMDEASENGSWDTAAHASPVWKSDTHPDE